MALIDLNIPAGVYRNGTDLQSQGRWRDANLVRWHDGVMRPIGGWRIRSDEAGDEKLRGMITWSDNDADRWIGTGSYEHLYVYNSSGTRYDITPVPFTTGRDDAVAFTGFGGGAFGKYAWGVARPDIANILPSTVWQLDTWGEYLVAMTEDDGKVYEWDLDTVFGSELVTNGTFDADSDWTKGNGGAGNPNWVIEDDVAKYVHYQPVFDAGDTAVVSDANDTITINNHRFADGDEVVYNVPSISTASAIDGLTDGSTYYIVSATTNTFKLAATSGGTAINLSTSTITVDADDAAVVDVSTDKVIAANTFANGDYVQYNNGGGTDIGGLVNGYSYFVVNGSASEFQLAFTSGGSVIDLTPKLKLTFDADDAAVVDVTNNKIIQANTFTNGDEVLYDVGGGVAIGGLTDATNYFIINASATEFQLAATSGGSAITLTANNEASFDGDDAAVVDIANDKIVTANTFSDGDEVVYSAGGGVAIGGLTDGANYFIVSSSASEFQLAATSGGAAITLTANNSVTIDSTDAAVVDVTNDKIVTANTFSDGDEVSYDAGGGTAIAGLTDGTNYFIVNATASEFQVAATSGGAAIDLTAVGVGASHVFRQDIGSSHSVRQDIGSSHSLEEDIGSSHTFHKDFGNFHDLDRQNFGNLEQTVSGLDNSADDEDAHDITVTLIDPNDDNDGTTVPDVNVKITGTTSATVLVDEKLEVGVNRFRFDTDDTEVKIEFVPNAYNTPNFHLDNVSLKNVPTANLLTNAPTQNKSIVVTEERFLFCLGAGGNPRKVQWSDREANNVWTPSTTNEAGDLELNTSGAIMKGMRVRGQTLILTTRDAHVANYIGPPYVYGFERVGTACGLAAREASVVVDQGAFWMGVNSFYTYNGSSVSELPCEVSDYVFNDINRAQISKAFGMSNAMFGEIWWFYPSSAETENNRYVVFNYVEGTWYIGELDRTAGADRGAFRQPMMAKASDKKIYEHEVGLEYDNLTPFAESGPFRIGTGDQVMAVTEMLPDEKTQGDVNATFKTRFYPNDTERSYGPYTMSNPTSVRFTGRQVRMRVEGVNYSDWRVGINRLDVIAGGRR